MQFEDANTGPVFRSWLRDISRRLEVYDIFTDFLEDVTRFLQSLHFWRNSSFEVSSELYAIFRAIHYFSRAGIGKVLIVSDSLAALSSLRDQLVGFVKLLLVFGIAHLLACAEENNRIVEFLWVPAHADIRSSGVADEVTRLVGRLSYQVQFGLPYVDLLDPIRGDCDAWAALASRSKYFSRVSYKILRWWFPGSIFPGALLVLLPDFA